MMPQPRDGLGRESSVRAKPQAKRRRRRERGADPRRARADRATRASPGSPSRGLAPFDAARATDRATGNPRADASGGSAAAPAIERPDASGILRDRRDRRDRPDRRDGSYRAYEGIFFPRDDGSESVM